MSKEFKSLKGNESGHFSPVVLLGPSGLGKIHRLLDYLAQDIYKTGGQKNPLYMPFNFSNDYVIPELRQLSLKMTPKDLDFFYVDDKIKSMFDRIEKQIGPKRTVVAIFEDADKYDPKILSAIIERMNNLPPGAVIPVLKCLSVPESLVTSNNISSVQVVEWQVPAGAPLLIDSHFNRQSPLHEYGDILERFKINREEKFINADMEQIQKLENLAIALDGMEGGMYSQNAIDRGMDIYVVNAIMTFVREHTNSPSAQVAGLASRFTSLLDKDKVHGKMIDHSSLELDLKDDMQVNQGYNISFGNITKELMNSFSAPDLPDIGKYPKETQESIEAIGAIAGILNRTVGGLYGEIARDIGVDTTVVNAMRNFTKKYENARDPQLAAVVSSYVRLIGISKTPLKLMSVSTEKAGPKSTEPSLG